MRKILVSFFIVLFAFILVGCNDNDDLLLQYENLVEENEQLVDENTELESENENLLEERDEIFDLLEDILEQISIQDTQLDILDDILDDISALKDNLDNIETELDELSAIQTKITQLVNSLSDLNLEVSEIETILNSVQKSIVEIQFKNYLDSKNFSEQFDDFFLEKTVNYINIGLSKEEAIEAFNTDYLAEFNLATNDDLSTVSTISLSKPAAELFDEVNVEIYYHDEFIESTTLNIDDNFDINFDAPNYGKYTLKTEVKYGDLVHTEEIVFGVTSSHYNMAYLNGTLGVLMYTADHVTNQESAPTFIELQRPSTYDWDELPENTYEFPAFISNQNWNYVAVGDLSDWIFELYSIDNSSTFTLNIADNYTGIAIVAFDRYQIPEENWTVNIWTDGTFTNNALNTYTSMTVLNDRVEYIEDYRESTLNLPEESINYSYLNTNVFYHALAYAYSLDNVNYIINSTSGLSIEDQDVINAINDTVETVTVAELFESLQNSGNINDFEYLLGTRWGEGDDEGMSYYFNSPKGQYILILGTSTSGETVSGTNKYYTFEDYLQQVIDLYGDDYEIFYKGHPAYPSSATRQQLFVEEGIIELDKSIPVEVLMYIYPNVYIGGYSGSSFLSSQEGQTLFFYGTEDYVKRIASLSDMIDNSTIFDNTIYLYDDSE